MGAPFEERICQKENPKRGGKTLTQIGIKGGGGGGEIMFWCFMRLRYVVLSSGDGIVCGSVGGVLASTTVFFLTPSILSFLRRLAS